MSVKEMSIIKPKGSCYESEIKIIENCFFLIDNAVEYMN